MYISTCSSVAIATSISHKIRDIISLEYPDKDDKPTAYIRGMTVWELRTSDAGIWCAKLPVIKSVDVQMTIRDKPEYIKRTMRISGF
jgi:hypothetical protein